MRELFSRVADRHGPAIRERHVTLEVDVKPPDLTVRADGQRLEQALQNLAANALRHTPEDGKLSLAARTTAGGTSITVRDTGPGIPPEHLPHIFETVLQGGCSPKRHQAVWQRPRAVDRSGDRRTPRWNRDRVERSGGGRDLRNHDSRRQYPETDPQSSD